MRGSARMTTSRLQEFIQSFGPAWMVMIADVDAPSVSSSLVLARSPMSEVRARVGVA